MKCVVRRNVMRRYVMRRYVMRHYVKSRYVMSVRNKDSNKIPAMFVD